MSEIKSEKIKLPINYKDCVFNSNQKPFIETYLLKTEKKLPVVVICPGGAYQMIAPTDKKQVAKKMNEFGFHAVVLSYSVAPMEFPAALCDLAETVALIRQNAESWKVDSDKVIVCGFSAGGHLAASLGCYWKTGILQDILPYTPELIQPNYMLLCYPVITADVEFCHEDSIRNVLGKNNLDERDFVSLEEHIDENFPKTFMWHTFSDTWVPVENTLLMANALRKAGIKFEYHLFQEGEHALTLAENEKNCASWVSLFKTWCEVNNI